MEEETFESVLIPPKGVKQIAIKEGKCVNIETEVFFPMLEDFIRFDISTTGILYCKKYIVSVQYEDKFLIAPSTDSTLHFYLREDKTCIPFSLHPTTGQRSRSDTSVGSRTFPIFQVYSNNPKKSLLGSVQRRPDGKGQRINNFIEKTTFCTRKVKEDGWEVKGHLGVRIAFIEAARSMRSNISSYGLSILDLEGVSPVSKALLISSVIALEMEEVKWTSWIIKVMSWISLILLLSLIPYYFYYNPNSQNKL